MTTQVAPATAARPAHSWAIPATYRSGHDDRGAGETDVTEPPLPRRRSPDFRRYWVARMVSIGRSLVAYVALPVLVNQVTGANLWTTFVLVAEGLPYLCLACRAG